MAMIDPGHLAGNHDLGGHPGGHRDEPGHGHGVDGRLMEHALLGTILFILLLTVLFEIGKHKLEHDSGQWLPIVQKLFGELTVLGFIGLLMFLVVKADILQPVSIWIFDDPHELAEIVESVHMGLFLVMMIFLSGSVALSVAAHYKQHAWIKHETNRDEGWVALRLAQRGSGSGKPRPRAAATAAAAAAGRPMARSRATFDLLWVRSDEQTEIEDIVAYFSLRTAFIIPRKKAYHRPRKMSSKQAAHEEACRKNVDTRFDFATYLGHALQEVMEEFVEVPHSAWLYIMGTSVLVWACVISTSVPAAGCDAAIWVCSLLAWAVVCAFVLVRTHLVWVRRQLCPDLYYRFGQSLAPGTASHGEQIERYNCTQSNEIALEELLSQTRMFPFERPWVEVLDSAPQFSRWFLRRGFAGGSNRATGTGGGAKPPELNQHDRMFYRGRPRLILDGCRTATLGVCCFAASHLAVFLPHWSATAVLYTPVGLAVAVWSVLPVVLVPRLMLQILPIYVQVTSVEHMTRHELAMNTVRDMKTRKTLSILSVVASLRFSSQRKQMTSFNFNVAMHANATADLAQAGHDKEISILFDHFDTDHSGTLGPDEVRGFLTALGICPPGPDGDTTAATIMRELDRDGGGDVSRDEFVKWVHAHLNHGAEKMSAEEVVEALFEALDEDRSGSISSDEFIRAVQLAQEDDDDKLTLDDIRMIIDEVDENRDGEVDKEEFLHMISKHIEHIT